MFYWLGGIGLVLGCYSIYRRSRSLSLPFPLSLPLLFNVMQFALEDKTKELEHVAGNVYAIPYSYKDREYKYFITLDLEDDLEIETFVSVGDVSVDISQQPGTSYAITPSDFKDPNTTIAMFCEEEDQYREFSGKDNVSYF